MTEEEKYIEEKKKILLDKYVNIIENNEIENAKEIQDDKYNLDLVKELIEMNKI